MNIKRSKIKLSNIQLKSLESAQRLCAAVNEIEEQCGIHQVRLTIERPWVCPWVDLEKLNATPMECLVRDLLKKPI